MSTESLTEAGAVQADHLTKDHLLDRRVVLYQPRDGYRAAIDPVLLAAAVPATAGDMVLEAGVGSGAAALCLATRVPDIRIAGIEKQRDMVRLAQTNVRENRLKRRVDIMTGDLKEPPSRLAAGSFHHVMMNPPFLEAETVRMPKDPSKALAHVESTAAFEDWIAFALKMLRPKGSVTVIHRADRLNDILGVMSRGLGDIKICPLWPRAGAPAKRVLVRGRKGLASPLSLTAGLCLHQADGAFTVEAEAVLRDGASLEF